MRGETSDKSVNRESGRQSRFHVTLISSTRSPTPESIAAHRC